MLGRAPAWPAVLLGVEAKDRVGRASLPRLAYDPSLQEAFALQRLHAAGKRAPLAVSAAASTAPSPQRPRAVRITRTLHRPSRRVVQRARGAQRNATRCRDSSLLANFVRPPLRRPCSLYAVSPRSVSPSSRQHALGIGALPNRRTTPAGRSSFLVRLFSISHGPSLAGASERTPPPTPPGQRSHDTQHSATAAAPSGSLRRPTFSLCGRAYTRRYLHAPYRRD